MAQARLVVCRSGFTYDAAKAIGGADIDDTLETLQIWRFVTYRANRYVIDPLTIAAVAADETAYQSHFDFYFQLAKHHHDQQDYFGLDIEWDNLEAAFEWAMRTEKFESAYLFATDTGQGAARLDLDAVERDEGGELRLLLSRSLYAGH